MPKADPSTECTPRLSRLSKNINGPVSIDSKMVHSRKSLRIGVTYAIHAPSCQIAMVIKIQSSSDRIQRKRGGKIGPSQK